MPARAWPLIASVLALSGCYRSHTIEPETDAGEPVETCHPDTQLLVFTGECVATEIASGDQAECEAFVPSAGGATGRGRPVEIVNRSGGAMQFGLEVISVGECAPDLCYECHLSRLNACSCDGGGRSSDRPPPVRRTSPT